MIGKSIRLNRIISDPSGKACIMPIDHGLTMGPIFGLENIKDLITKVTSSGVDSVILHKGMLKRIANYNIGNNSYIMHLSGSTILSNDRGYKVLVADVEEAVRYGSDAVSIQVNFGNKHEHEVLRDFGIISKKCEEYGMPLLVMVYCENNSDALVHASRAAEELGADMIKINCLDNIELFDKIKQVVNIPIFVSGGEKTEFNKIASMVDICIKKGATGISIGRNIFQSENVCAIARKLSEIVKKN